MFGKKPVLEFDSSILPRHASSAELDALNRECGLPGGFSCVPASIHADLAMSDWLAVHAHLMRMMRTMPLIMGDPPDGAML